MLHELSIRNFAIIDDLYLSFGQGFNILTGETGAGKSIIIDALGLLLGDRAAAEWVRAGAEIAEIEATFHLAGTAEVSVEVQQMLEELGLDDPDSAGWLTLSREVRLNGRNVCRINGRVVNLQTLSEVAGLSDRRARAGRTPQSAAPQNPHSSARPLCGPIASAQRSGRASGPFAQRARRIAAPTPGCAHARAAHRFAQLSGRRDRQRKAAPRGGCRTGERPPSSRQCRSTAPNWRNQPKPS